jgi:hypothetical protein
MSCLIIDLLRDKFHAIHGAISAHHARKKERPMNSLKKLVHYIATCATMNQNSGLPTLTCPRIMYRMMNSDISSLTSEEISK